MTNVKANLMLEVLVMTIMMTIQFPPATMTHILVAMTPKELNQNRTLGQNNVQKLEKNIGNFAVFS